MIIRAVSSGSDDDDDDDHGHSATGSLPPSPWTDASLSTSTAVKLAWLGASLALVALLLLDLAALVGQYLPGDAPPRTVDPFTFVSWALLLWRRQTTTLQPATVLNNLVGQVFVGAWIFGRETALAVQRQRASSSRQHGPSIRTPVWLIRHLPWVLVVAMLCLGHVVSCGYILFALFESHGSGNVGTKFWLGRSSARNRAVAPRV